MSRATRHVYPTKTQKSKYSVIIPSAGLSNRMKSYGPQSLIELNNETLLQRQLNWIDKNFPLNEVILIGGFEADKLFDNTPNHIIKIENERYEETNIIRSIAIGLRASTTDNVIILNGDLYFKDITITWPKHSCLLSCDLLMPKEEVGCVITNGFVTNIMYDLSTKWSQICYFEGNELDIFRELCYNKDNEKKYTFELINEIIDLGYQIQCISPKNFWCIDIDSITDLKAIKDYANFNDG